MSDTMRIEQAVEQDADVIAQLIGEIEAYYGGKNPAINADEVRARLFGTRPVATVLLARDGGGQVLGMASYSFLWPAAGADASLYLKELFVREGARRRGVATALMDQIRHEATNSACTRVEWTADRDNGAAQAFYAALGARPHDGKAFYRLDQSH
ncbi:N-acetyltransferase family protein [Streptomyces sp. URMC 127]|uniref:GNAT family N-acetyltransferase n=1 Tax=Streptomyces sp. URMC 127 TaxID=3423402 RepID=UPI003F1C3CB4